MDRSNHYEAAFEAYLRDRRLGYIAVDESKRSTLDDDPVKSIDFIVHGLDGAKLWSISRDASFRAAHPTSRGCTWQNWVARDDVEGLERWQTRFGIDYQPLLVFAYCIHPDIDLRQGTEDLWVWNGFRYLMRAVRVSEYRAHMRVRSPRWGTVHLPTAIFRELVRPLREFTHPE